MVTHREGCLLERAFLEGDIDQDAIVDVEYPGSTVLEVDSEKMSISAFEGLPDVGRFAVAVGVCSLSAGSWSVIW